jgi:valyl-tRNA synthetase
VEYLRSSQWFVKVKDRKEEIVRAARAMQWVPGFTLQYLLDWANGLEYDWVISRQRVYGTPLPFWHCEKCGEVIPAHKDKLPVDPAHDPAPVEKCPRCGAKPVGETSTADCWLDSSITPLAIAGWPDDPKFLARAYPAGLRPQGIEIIRTWAFYTIARCLELTGKPPFQDLLIHGSVLGRDGKKMSKSKGNFEDPEVILAKYPADALRQWAALSGALGKDRVFDYKDVERGRAFLIKYWNAARFIEKALEGYEPKGADPHQLPLRAADRWLLSRLQRLIQQVTQALDGYDYYQAITALHSFTWNELCDLYLEEVKYRVYMETEDAKAKESKRAAQYVLHRTLHALTRMLAPFLAFTAEEVWSSLAPKEGSVHRAAWPAAEAGFINEAAEEIAGALHEALSLVRRYKASNGIALSEDLELLEVTAPERVLKLLPDVEEELRATARAKAVAYAKASEDAPVSVKVTP